MYQRKLRLHRSSEESLPPEVVQMLPFASLEAASFRKYVEQGFDFIAFCVARGLRYSPANFESLGGYYLDYFIRGNTTRTFSSISTRLKWFHEYILEVPWLQQSDPSAYARVKRLRRALCKLDDTPVKKARPLHARILRMIASSLQPGNLLELQVLACFTLAHAAIQRLGELVDGKATVSHLRCYDSPGGRFFAFFYFLGNKPKNFKIGQAPFAMISQRGNPFAYAVLDTYLRQVFGGYSVIGGVFTTGSRAPLDVSSDDRKSRYLFPSLRGKLTTSGFLSKSLAISTLRSLLRRVRIPSPELYSGHSARRGGYVDRLHVPLHFVQVQGHWAPGSATTDRDYSVHNIPLRLRYF